MKKRWLRIFLVCLGLGLLFGGTPFAVAQEDEDAFTLEEITVTAQKREENQQKVGIAMEVFTGEDLKTLGRYDVDQILSSISTAYVARTAEGLRVSLRGVAFDTPAGYGSGAMNAPGTVSVNLNGVYTAKRPTGTGLYDIDRVEVLFGPQSTVYASNAPGGIVNVELKKPKLDTYEASGSIEYGNYELLHMEGAINVPVNDTMALRAAFTTQVRDGYLSNGGDDEDSKSARFNALFQPNEKFSILLTGQMDKSSNYGMTSILGFKDQDDVSDPWYTDQVITADPTTIDVEKIDAHIDLDLGFGSLTVIPATYEDDYYQTQSGPLPGPGPPIIGDSITEGWGTEDGVEARLVSPAESNIKWSLVYNWYKGENYRASTSTVRATGVTTQTDYRQNIETKAYLGNVTVPVTDTFRAVVGLRYSEDYARSQRINVIGGGGPETDSIMNYDGTNYKIGIEYDLAEDSMLFADYSTSYRVEGEAMKWDGTTLPPQEMTAYTAGIKNRLFDNKLQLNVSAFYYDYTDRVHQAMQFATIYFSPPGAPPGPQPNGTYCVPGSPDFFAGFCMSRPDEGGRVPGDLTMKGVDIQTQWIITNDDKLDVSISYLDSWIDKMIADYEFKDQPYSSEYDFSNRKPTFSPDWTVSLNYSHNFNLPNGATLTGRFDTRYQTEYEIDWWQFRGGVDQTGYKTQEAHHIDNLTIVYTSPDGKWTLSGYAKNIWDYAEKRFMTAMGAINMNIGPPRTYGAILSVNY